jgi:hypothetical protein
MLHGRLLRIVKAKQCIHQLFFFYSSVVWETGASVKHVWLLEMAKMKS